MPVKHCDAVGMVEGEAQGQPAAVGVPADGGGDDAYRGPDPADRRRVLLAVTEAARELGWGFFGPLISTIVETLDGEFTADERDVLRRVLVRLDQVVP